MANNGLIRSLSLHKIDQKPTILFLSNIQLETLDNERVTERDIKLANDLKSKSFYDETSLNELSMKNEHFVVENFDELDLVNFLRQNIGIKINTQLSSTAHSRIGSANNTEKVNFNEFIPHSPESMKDYNNQAYLQAGQKKSLHGNKWKDRSQRKSEIEVMENPNQYINAIDFNRKADQNFAGSNLLSNEKAFVQSSFDYDQMLRDIDINSKENNAESSFTKYRDSAKSNRRSTANATSRERNSSSQNINQETNTQKYWQSFYSKNPMF